MLPPGTGTPEHRSARTPECPNAGVPEHRNAGAPPPDVNHTSSSTPGIAPCYISQRVTVPLPFGYVVCIIHEVAKIMHDLLVGG